MILWSREVLSVNGSVLPPKSRTLVVLNGGGLNGPECCFVLVAFLSDVDTSYCLGAGLCLLFPVG